MTKQHLHDGEHIRVGVDEAIMNQIVQLILSYKAVEKIVLFGSRASGQYRRTSDIDIAIFGKEWTDMDINLIKDRLEEEVRTPLTFDVVNFYRIAREELKQHIMQHGRSLYESSAH